MIIIKNARARCARSDSNKPFELISRSFRIFFKFFFFCFFFPHQAVLFEMNYRLFFSFLLFQSGIALLHVDMRQSKSLDARPWVIRCKVTNVGNDSTGFAVQGTPFDPLFVASSAFIVYDNTAKRVVSPFRKERVLPNNLERLELGSFASRSVDIDLSRSFVFLKGHFYAVQFKPSFGLASAERLEFKITLQIFCSSDSVSSRTRDGAEKGVKFRVSLIQSSAIDTPWLILFSFRNPMNVTLTLCTRFTPFEGLMNPDAVHVTHANKSLSYTGPLVSRTAEPVSEEFVFLLPNQTLQVSIDLSTGFLFRKGNLYEVSSVFTAQFKRLDDTESFSEILASNILLIRPAKDSLFPGGSEQKERRNFSLRGDFILSGCSTAFNFLLLQSEVDAVKQAVGLARVALTSAIDKLCAGSYLFLRWFGTDHEDDFRRMRTRSNLQKIRNKIDEGGFSISCSSCSDRPPGVVAWVNLAQEFDINLCISQFFPLRPMYPTFGIVLGTKAQTLIHEFSHFVSLGFSRDNAYGESQSKELLSISPYLASENADSIGFFCIDATLNFPPVVPCIDTFPPSADYSCTTDRSVLAPGENFVITVRGMKDLGGSHLDRAQIIRAAVSSNCDNIPSSKIVSCVWIDDRAVYSPRCHQTCEFFLNHPKV
jgi:hypothetical protein